MTLQQRALEIAITQLGKKEDPLGSNWGHPVKDYLGSVGINFPASWCYAFVYWCFDQAAAELKILNPLPRTGGVLEAWRRGMAARVTGGCQPGDIMIMDHGHGLGHTGIVEIDKDAHIIETVEGNTNNSGSRNGVDVERKKRDRMTVLGYLRFI